MDAVQRELVNKVDGTAMTVTATAFGEGTVDFTTDLGTFTFVNNDNNTFENEIYTVREIGHEAPAPLEVVAEPVVEETPVV